MVQKPKLKQILKLFGRQLTYYNFTRSDKHGSVNKDD